MPTGRRQLGRLRRELAVVVHRQVLAWQGLKSGQRRMAMSLLLGLLGLRVVGSLVAQPYDDATFYELTRK